VNKTESLNNIFVLHRQRLSLSFDLIDWARW